MISDNEDRVFVIGGLRRDGRARNRVDQYIISKNQWGIMPRMNQARAWTSGCLLGDSIYVVGGMKRDRDA